MSEARAWSPCDEAAEMQEHIPDGASAFNDPLAMERLRDSESGSRGDPKTSIIIGCGNLHYDVSRPVPPRASTNIVAKSGAKQPDSAPKP